MADATPVEGEVDHQLTRGGPVKRSGRPSDDDRAEDRDFNAVRASRRGTVGGGPPLVTEMRSPKRGQRHFVGAEGFEPSLGTV